MSHYAGLIDPIFNDPPPLSSQPTSAAPSAATTRPADVVSLADLLGQEQPTPAPVPEKVPELGGRRDGPEPTRYGDWEKNGRCIDF